MSSEMREYRTGFETLGAPDGEPTGPYRGAGWTATLVPENRESAHIVGGMDIVVSARNWPAAQRATDLIDGCRILINGNPDVFGRVQPVAYNETEPEWMEPWERSSLSDPLLAQPSLATACAVAAKASRRRMWTYAVARYKFSVGLYSVHHMDMQPSYRIAHPVSKHPDDHVLLSHAILAAYSVVEELGLNVPASRERPSRIKGAWNPEVLADLEARLKQHRVGPDEEILWLVRGPATRIERRRPLPSGSAVSWTGWPVRDRSLPVVDAVAHGDYLRDRVVAHNTKDLTRSLTPYDVVNVQHLARFLLLSSLDMRVWLPQRSGSERSASGPADER